MSTYGTDPDSGLPHGQPDPDTDEVVTALREASAAERYHVLDAKAGYGPGLYAVRLPAGDFGPAAAPFRRGLALCRRHGDYDRAERAWYIRVILPGQHSAGALAELAGLGAVITREDQEEPS